MSPKRNKQGWTICLSGSFLVAFLIVVLANAPLASGSFTFQTNWGASGSEHQLAGAITTDSSGNVYVSTSPFSGPDLIYKFSPSGAFIASWNSNFGSHDGLATDPAGNVFVLSTDSERIEKYSPSGAYITGWGQDGQGPGEFEHPRGIATDPAGNVYVADSHNDRIQKFTSSGTFVTSWESDGYPAYLATDSKGNVYVVGFTSEEITKFGPSGSVITRWYGNEWGENSFAPHGITTDPSDNVYIADSHNDQILKFSSSGTFISKWAEAGSGGGSFKFPEGIVSDSRGNVYVADTGNNRIVKLTVDPILQCSDVGAAVAGDQACRFQPMLAFDEDEEWRPQDVDLMLQENKHYVCHAFVQIEIGTLPTCGSVSSAEALWPPSQLKGLSRLWFDPNGPKWLDEEGHSSEKYTAKNADPSTCPVEPGQPELRDCGSSPYSRIYFHSGQVKLEGQRTSTPYNFQDYWWYFRFNDAPGYAAGDKYDHESDWEGSATITNPQNGRPSFFAFRSHGPSKAFLPNLTMCGPLKSSCAEAPLAQQRPWVFVADGSHASYPGPCSQRTSGAPSTCTQIGGDEVVVDPWGFEPITVDDFPGSEANADGKYPWAGNNQRTDSLSGFPISAGSADTGNWNEFPGAWDIEGHVRSPSQQEPYKNPAGFTTEEECYEWCPETALSAGIGARASTLTDSSIGSCLGWFGGSVATTVCDADTIRSALMNGTFDSSGLFVDSQPKDLTADTANGLIQVGGRPLLVGESVRVRGRSMSGGVAFARATGKKSTVEALFTHVATNSKKATAFLAKDTPSGEPTLALRKPDGTLVGPTIELIAEPGGRVRSRSTPSYRPRLKLYLKWKRTGIAQMRVKTSVRNLGENIAKNTTVCLAASKKVRRYLRFKKCQKLGSIRHGKTRSKPIVIRRKSKRFAGLSRKVKVRVKVSAVGAKPIKRIIRVPAR